jgi:hypothetical protein
MATERKPLGALILAQASPEKSSGGAEAQAFDELVSALGVKPDDVDAARMALTDFVRACIAKGKTGGYKDKAAADTMDGSMDSGY